MATPYSVVFKNNSSNPGNVCFFQQDPNMSNPNVMSLAWFTQFCYPSTAITYNWNIQFSFVWGQTGPIAPGVMFSAAQTLNADLATTNQITLTYAQAFNFVNQGPGASSGSLFVTEDKTVPAGQASVGIGMSGAGTFVANAQPNINLTFSPHPTYWIAFGTYSTGQVLNVQSMTGSAQITFPVNVYQMSAVLNADNTWTIQPLGTTNAKFFAAAFPERAAELRKSQQQALAPGAVDQTQTGSGLYTASRIPDWGS